MLLHPQTSMASPMVAVPEKTRVELEAVRSMVESLLANGALPHESSAIPKTIKKFLGRHLDKKPKKGRPPSVYKPRENNNTVYAPRHLEIVRQFLECVKSNPGDVTVRASTPNVVYTSKIMTIRFIDRIAPRDDDNDETRRLRVSLSLALVQVCARLVEAMDTCMREQPERFSGARYAMQQAHKTPGWGKKVASGTGVALNGTAETRLLPVAIAMIEAQLATSQPLSAHEHVDGVDVEGSESKSADGSEDD
jgi:hypothetical protein